MTLMPALFIGHGSPMNALEDNPVTATWRRLGSSLPRPSAILCLSAHWYVDGLRVTAAEQPPTLHDFGGFPPELHAVEYAARGNHGLCTRVQELLAPEPVARDDSWGFDHGSWSVLTHLFPDADIPVVQLSLDIMRRPRDHFLLGQRLAPLRSEGVLVLASGNVVHNLRRMSWLDKSGGFDWAQRFEGLVRELIERRSFEELTDLKRLGEDAHLAAPTPEHFLPLLYVLGMARPDDAISFPTAGIMHGSISMLSVLVGG
jgi:4,5-DOPA dioxygenase extradiol